MLPSHCRTQLKSASATEMFDFCCSGPKCQFFIKSIIKHKKYVQWVGYYTNHLLAVVGLNADALASLNLASVSFNEMPFHV